MQNRLAYAVAALLFGISLVGYTISGLSFNRTYERIQEIDERIAAMPRVPIPGRSEVNLLEVGEYTIFFEEPSAETDSDGDTPELRLELRADDGGLVQIRTAERSVSYDLSQSGVSAYKFQTSRPGRYQVAAEYPEGSAEHPAILAFGKGLESDVLEAVVPGAWWLLWSVGIAASVVIAALTYFRRLDPASNQPTRAGRSPQ